VATLHVRNVPEPLYELLRECAEREGRSIGAQATTLLQQALLSRREMRSALATIAGGARRTPPGDRFSSGGRRTVARASDYARELKASQTAPGHVLLALLDEDAARAALEAAGVTAAAVRARLPRGEGSPAQIPFAPETKALLERALRAALTTRSEQIGWEQLLVAFDADPLLVELGVPPGALALQAARLPPPLMTLADEREYLAVDLEGTADDWTDRLNDVADGGWELMQIVERRAILRRA
jgi:plasmid stability protein